MVPLLVAAILETRNGTRGYEQHHCHYRIDRPVLEDRNKDKDRDKGMEREMAGGGQEGGQGGCVYIYEGFVLGNTYLPSDSAVVVVGGGGITTGNHENYSYR